MSVTYADVAAAHERIKGHAVHTPVLSSSAVNERVGAQVFFKCENLQNMGAFKFRGAFNALSQLSPEEKRRGVLAYSSGNHAQAVALAGKLLGIRTTIVMPADAPKVKLEGTRSHGAEVILYSKDESREEVAARISRERQLAVIPPFNHPHVIAGQGTAAKELIEETGPLDALFVPVGGGGLISGCALAARALASDCKVIGVEPEAGDDVTRSFRSGQIVSIPVPQTIADGARTQAPGDLTFPLVLANVDEMLTVSDDALLRAMFYLWEKLRTIVEPTGALGACALLEGKLSLPGKRVGVILSGGNVDLAWAAAALRARS
ncbi:MAG: threo-3-hydroxy-L-aspartate ammonia-lyase [Betaproteobacteria bacterium]|nr:threo-3-hydroxy-L-aspartate ammonia-lyase [Betaproteobacteria bacterium]